MRNRLPFCKSTRRTPVNAESNLLGIAPDELASVRAGRTGYCRGMAGPYLFHAVTLLVAGTDALVPVAELKVLDPVAHAKAMSKYDDSPERGQLARAIVPVIERRWTEVVFLSPVHPYALWSAWREITGEELPAVKFWQIPIDAVPADAVVFDRSTSVVGQPIHEHEVVALDRSTYWPRLQTTDANRAWLASLAERGHRGAWFNRTPHVLTAGPVPLAAASTISGDIAPDELASIRTG